MQYMRSDSFADNFVDLKLFPNLVSIVQLVPLSVFKVAKFVDNHQRKTGKLADITNNTQSHLATRGSNLGSNHKTIGLILGNTWHYA